jgi:predicted HNH restriction endonuclease
MLDYLDPTPIATGEQFKRALLAIRDRDGISPTELGMLRTHCRAPKHTITATKLAHEAGFANYAAANLQYGTLAHAVADRLGYTPIKRDDGTTCWWFTLSVGADESDDTDESHFEWIMRPELVQALQEMKWA